MQRGAGGRAKVRVILECAWCLHISSGIFSAGFAHQSKSCIGRPALCAHLLLRAPRVLRFELWEKGGRKKYNALSIKCKTKIDLTRSALSLLPAELVAAIIWQRQHHGEHRNHQPATPFSLILSWRFFSLLGARTPSQLRGHVLCRMIRTWPLAPRRMPWNNYPPPTDMCVCGLGGERFDLWPAKLFRGLPRPV